MTRSDQWKKRACVVAYWAYKDALRKAGASVPESGAHITFHLPMPKSWSKKKKAAHDGRPHQQKPDLDNLLKGYWDALCKDDSFLWDVRATKLWAYEGSIVVIKK